MTTFGLRHFPVKSGRFLCLFGLVQGWLREVWQGEGQSQEVQGSLELQNGGLRGLEEAWMRIQVEAISCQVLGAVAWHNGRSSLSRRLGRSSPSRSSPSRSSLSEKILKCSTSFSAVTWLTVYRRFKVCQHACCTFLRKPPADHT